MFIWFSHCWAILQLDGHWLFAPAIFRPFQRTIIFLLWGVGFSYFSGPRLTTFLLLKEATHSKNIQTFGQILGANFGTNFGYTFLSFFISRYQNWAPKMGFKIGPQNLKVGALPLHPARAEWLPTQDPIKLENPPLKAEFTDCLRWLGACWSKLSVSIQSKITQQWENPNQMNIPNFCSRMLIEHWNLKRWIFLL